MTFSIKYKPLFEVKIYHLFFLNNGTVKFNSMNETDKAKQINNYYLNSILRVFPTYESALKLGGYNLVFKSTNTGFTIWSKVSGNSNDEPFISLENDLDFTFLLQMNDPLFLNYTDLKSENAGKKYYFSNRRLQSEPNNFPLIDKAGGNKNVDESFILSDDGVKSVVKELKYTEKQNLIGLIHIFIKADTGSLNITDAQNKIPDPSQSFTINFKNRETIWRYFFDNNQNVSGNDDLKKEDGNSKILITKEEQPLTQNGFISIELGGIELPNPDARNIKPDTSNNKYYSEIYM